MCVEMSGCQNVHLLLYNYIYIYVCLCICYSQLWEPVITGNACDHQSLPVLPEISSHYWE